jgi:leucyl/phenylalanyl-tRNA--protein transferase
MLVAYARLHELGWAHSLEVWEGEALVGGIYGIAVGGAFAGESMFHRRTDASKIAFAELAKRLKNGGFVLFDAQVLTEHLASLGCIAIPRREFLMRLASAALMPPLLLR